MDVCLVLCICETSFKLDFLSNCLHGNKRATSGDSYEWKEHTWYSIILDPYRFSHRASLVAQMVKNLPAMWETWVQSLGWEDPLEEGMATHSSRTPMDRGAWWAMVHGVTESAMTEWLSTQVHQNTIGKLFYKFQLFSE